MSEDARGITVSLERLEDFQFRVTFDEGMEELLMDEPEPLGAGEGPNASAVLSAAIGNCLSASLLFCLQKSRVDTRDVRTDVRTTVDRNERGRLRVQGTEVEILADVPDDDGARLERCLGMFEDFCIVTQAVRHGFDVQVTVVDARGEELHRSRDATPTEESEKEAETAEAEEG